MEILLRVLVQGLVFRVLPKPPQLNPLNTLPMKDFLGFR